MKSLLSITILFLALNILSAQSADSARYADIGPEDFLSLIRFNDKSVLIDVRLPFEFRKERIEGAVNIPVSKTGKTGELPGKESVILVYCTTGLRSKWAAEKYYDLGYRFIYNLDGGIEAWERKGLELIRKKNK